MKTELNDIVYKDPFPARIGCTEWHNLFGNIPDEFIDHYRYYRHCGKNEWNTYLYPPTTFLIYGSRYLRKLKFDNSLASLRLWGFMMNESERLFRAKQSGMKIIANMGDLGAIPPLIFSFKDTIPFYPDCYWWTPFLNESTVLFEEAERLGIGEDCCFVRAALGAYSKLAYFPEPDLGIVATGASCNDMNSVMQSINRLDFNMHWFEIPHRRDPGIYDSDLKNNERDLHRMDYQPHLKTFVIEEMHNLISRLEEVTGQKYEPDALVGTIKKINKLRGLVYEIRDIAFSAVLCPIPALELMNLEFITLSAYSDLDEAIDIAQHLKDTVRERVKNGKGISDNDAARVIWITPPADPILLNYLEDLGGRLVGTEFVINQSLRLLDSNPDPLVSLSDGLLNASLIGTTRSRTKLILRQIEKYDAEGIIISNIFASSHCSFETTLIKEFIRENYNIPILSFDVVAPGKKIQQSQILNRMTAFIETIKEKKRS